MDRTGLFNNAKILVDDGKLDEAFQIIERFTNEPEIEYSMLEMQIINTIICEKLTSCSFEEKKEACWACLPLLENVKLLKSAEWLEHYTDAVYEVFSKLSRHARENERIDVWEKVKILYYEITLAAKKVWKEKNVPAALEIYVGYSKLVKSYFDVADEDSFKICETFAKEAKFVGKGLLDDDEYRDSKKAIEMINKLLNDAKKDQEMLE